jgi:hypothetical protein
MSVILYIDIVTCISDWGGIRTPKCDVLGGTRHYNDGFSFGWLDLLAVGLHTHT